MRESLMKKLSLLVLAVVALFGVTSSANAAETLQTNDFVGITFWLVSMSLMAATAFFFAERNTVAQVWRTSITVSGLVTGVAFIHYLYMRGIWVDTGETPTVYRYIDWLITVPLLMIEFYLILAAVKKVPGSMFWKLLVASLIMLIGGYMGETDMMGAFLGFLIGMAAWIYIIYEIFSGDTAKAAKSSGNKSVKTAFNAMRWIVTIGWAIYPLGYMLGELMGTANPDALNAIYNLADFINKIAFGLIIWHCAMQNTSVSKR
jgi:bacteriorhodopsin